MNDDLKNRGPADRSKINLCEPWEVKYWTHLLDCTDSELRDAVRFVGNAAIVAGSIAYYGTYTVDEGTNTIVPKVKGSTFPNMVGTDQSRIVTSITTDEMHFTNPKAPAGVLEIVWRRAK